MRAKMFNICKKGDRVNPTKNYCGISVINSCAKLYNLILSSRLKQRFISYGEQAGTQEKPGWIEHIMTLSIMCDIARRKKYKLFVTFVDFSQAYDLVPRQGLFHVLKRSGCMRRADGSCVDVHVYHNRECGGNSSRGSDPRCAPGVAHHMFASHHLRQ